MKRSHHLYDTIELLTDLTRIFDEKRKNGLLKRNYKYPLYPLFYAEMQKGKNITVHEVFTKQLSLLPGYVLFFDVFGRLLF